jgi:RNA polymerase sigma-70 factor (ECF subfamily)
VTATDEHAERFTHLRPLLFTIAYEILGSATESDDVLQDSYLRWAGVDLATVRDTKAYLAQLVTRQALNALRANVRRREYYFGPWLPEPILVTEHDGAADVVLAESISMGMLVLLETLTPNERAVFVLHEVFGFDYDDIASAVGRSVTAVRQMAHRAREHIQARRKRFGPVETARAAAVTQQFLTAAATGDLAGLLSLLAPDVTWTTDSGGKAVAVRQLVMTDAKQVASMFLALFREMRRRPDLRVEVVSYNSQPAMAIHLGELGEAACLLEISNGKITHGFSIRNPEKLAALAVPRTIARGDTGLPREPRSP